MTKVFMLIFILFSEALFCQSYPDCCFPWELHLYEDYIFTDTIIKNRKIKQINISFSDDSVQNKLILTNKYDPDSKVDTTLDFEKQHLIVHFGRKNGWSEVYDMTTGKRKEGFYGNITSEDSFPDSTIYENGRITKIIRNANNYEIFKYDSSGMFSEWFVISNMIYIGMDSLGFQMYDTTKWDTIRKMKNEFWDGKVLKKRFLTNGINGGNLENYFDYHGNLLTHYYYYEYGTENVICEYENGLRKSELWCIDDFDKAVSYSFVYYLEYFFQ